MEDYKENWREYYPPTIPIYFIDIEALKELIETSPEAITDQGLDMMLGYFEEYEKYEKAAAIRDLKWKRGLFPSKDAPTTDSEKKTDDAPDFDPPDDGHEWTWIAHEKQWVRKATDEETKRYMMDQQDINKDGKDDNDNPYRKPNPFE